MQVDYVWAARRNGLWTPSLVRSINFSKNPSLILASCCAGVDGIKVWRYHLSFSKIIINSELEDLIQIVKCADMTTIYEWHNVPEVMADWWGTSIAISFKLWIYLIESITGRMIFKPCNEIDNPAFDKMKYDRFLMSIMLFKMLPEIF